MDASEAAPESRAVGSFRLADLGQENTQRASTTPPAVSIGTVQQA